jgi:hypothetical protein
MSGPHDAPSAVELVEAVREFLEGEVMTATDGRVRFHARVAARALAIVERELAAGGGPAAAHARRLAALGFASDGRPVGRGGRRRPGHRGRQAGGRQPRLRLTTHTRHRPPVSAPVGTMGRVGDRREAASGGRLNKGRRNG